MISSIYQGNNSRGRGYLPSLELGYVIFDWTQDEYWPWKFSHKQHRTRVSDWSTSTHWWLPRKSDLSRIVEENKSFLFSTFLILFNHNYGEYSKWYLKLNFIHHIRHSSQARPTGNDKVIGNWRGGVERKNTSQLVEKKWKKKMNRDQRFNEAQAPLTSLQVSMSRSSSHCHRLFFPMHRIPFLIMCSLLRTDLQVVDSMR